MALEDLTGTGKFISALNPTWPTDDDWVDEGDNHLRGIKNVLKNTFPNVDGAVTLSDEQLNRVTVATPDSRIINGNFAIDQRNAGAAGQVTSGITYTLDRWVGNVSGGGTLAMSRVLDGGASVGEFYMSVNVGTTDAALAAGDVYNFGQSIEGSNLADLHFGSAGAQEFTVACEMLPSVAGSYGVSFRNYLANKSYVATVNLTTGSWNQVKIVVPGPTSGAWQYGNQNGLMMFIGLGIGSTYNAPAANQWVDGNFLSVAGCVNMMATAGATLLMRRVRLYPGAIDYGPCQRLYADELRLCQRYFEKSYDIGTVLGTVTVIGAVGAKYGFSGQIDLRTVVFKVPKRVAPTMSGYDSLNGAVGTWENANQPSSHPAIAFHETGENSGIYSLAAQSAGDFVRGHWTASAEL